MNKDLKLKDVFGASFVEEAKKLLVTYDEETQYHFIQWIVRNFAYAIWKSFPEKEDIRCCSKRIVAQELGDCCQMVHTVCKEQHKAYCICSGSVRPL